jgi:hypothetical protein
VGSGTRDGHGGNRQYDVNGEGRGAGFAAEEAVTYELG